MDWLDWLLNDRLAYLLIVFAVTCAVAAVYRKGEWFDTGAFGVTIAAIGFFVFYTAFVGFGPLSLVGFGLLWVQGAIVGLSTAAVFYAIRNRLRRRRAP